MQDKPSQVVDSFGIGVFIDGRGSSSVFVKWLCHSFLLRRYYGKLLQNLFLYIIISQSFFGLILRLSPFQNPLL